MYNVVIPNRYFPIISKMDGFKKELGMSKTDPKSADKQFGFNNSKDSFFGVYYNKYKDSLSKNGSYGSLMFHTNHAFPHNYDKIQIFDNNNEQYDFKWDDATVLIEGVMKFIGTCILHIQNGTYVKPDSKISESDYNDLTLRGMKGDPDAVFKNPGSVTYTDIMEYMNKYKKTIKKENAGGNKS